jgi:hypothetical protein
VNLRTGCEHASASQTGRWFEGAVLAGKMIFSFQANLALRFRGESGRIGEIIQGHGPETPGARIPQPGRSVAAFANIPHPIAQHLQWQSNGLCLASPAFEGVVPRRRALGWRGSQTAPAPNSGVMMRNRISHGEKICQAAWHRKPEPDSMQAEG